MPPPTGRILATVTSTHGSYVRAMDDWGATYFVLFNAVQQTGRFGFADLQPGSRVRLTAIEHPKGLRGIEVEVVSR